MSGDRIGPTAHFTAATWEANGLSPPELATPLGRLLRRTLAPLDALYAATGRQNLRSMLLERHLGVDAALSERVAAGEVGQVLELAAGLSGRGLRLTRRHPGLVYVESDLPRMAARKRALLEGRGALGPDHRVAVLDVAAPGQLEARLAELDPSAGTAAVVEGLLPYLPRPALDALLRRLAAALAPFPAGVVVTELNFADDLRGGLTALTALGLQQGLRVLVGGAVHVHFASPDEARAAFEAAGFSQVRFAPPRPRPHPPLVRIVTADV